jgi:uncharacterized protein (DUF58 family)
MKITPNIANTYGYISIAIMVLLLIAVLFELVPRSWYYPLFAVALTLYMIRLTMRLVLARQARLERETKQKTEAEKDEPGTMI